jgi:hypothetical protein
LSILLTPNFNEGNETSPLFARDQAILECVKKTLHRYGGKTPNLFLYSIRSRSMLKDFEIPSKPEEFEECLDNIFDGSSVIVKRSIIEEVKMKFGLAQDCDNLKEAFESARKN